MGTMIIQIASHKTIKLARSTEKPEAQAQPESQTGKNIAKYTWLSNVTDN